MKLDIEEAKIDDLVNVGPVNIPITFEEEIAVKDEIVN